MQHFVVEEILECVARAGWAVKDLADDNGIVRGVVVAEGTLGVVFAPGEVGPTEQAAEETHVETVKDFFEMEEAAFWAGDALGATGVANEFGLARYSGRGSEALVSKPVGGVYWLFRKVELGQKNVRDGVEDGFRRALEQIREADVDIAFTEADGCVEGSEAAETDGDRRHGSARPERSVFLLKDGNKIGGHNDSLQLSGASCQLPVNGIEPGTKFQQWATIKGDAS
jgi:hypothetical protein